MAVDAQRSTVMLLAHVSGKSCWICGSCTNSDTRMHVGAVGSIESWDGGLYEKREAGEARRLRQKSQGYSVRLCEVKCAV